MQGTILPLSNFWQDQVCSILLHSNIECCCFFSIVFPDQYGCSWVVDLCCAISSSPHYADQCSHSWTVLKHWNSCIPYRAGWQAQNGQGRGTCSWENGLQIFLPTIQVCPSAHVSQRQCSRVGVIIALGWRARGTSWGKEQLQHSTCPRGWRSPCSWRKCSGKSFPLSGCAWIWPWGLLLVLKGLEPILISDRGMSGVGGNRKNTLLSRNSHMYNGGVRYFIPFCCEQSCKKPFYTLHTDKPLTERVAGWRKSRDRTLPSVVSQTDLQAPSA